MIPYVRREKILAWIGQHEIVYLPQLLALFPATSESTLRRDLKMLADSGQVTLLHGGAVKLHAGSALDLPIVDKLTLYQDKKALIAGYAALLVHDGDVVYLDSSTTVLPMLPHLRGKAITIITSSADLIGMLDDEGITCIVLGGEVLPKTRSIVGSMTEQLLGTLFFDKAFVGANGFSLTGGITTPDYREMRKKQLVREHSQTMYMLMDSSKAGVTTLCKVFELEECTIITDAYHELLEHFLAYTVVPAVGQEDPSQQR